MATNKTGTGTGTGVKAAPTLEDKVKAATAVWAKAESSALWGLVAIVWEGVQDVSGADRKQRISAIRAWINQTLEDVHGPGGAADRDAHVSKIIKIGTSAAPSDLKRYKDQGIGFYKAYAEWSKPTPAKTKEGKEGAAAGTPAPASQQGPTPQTFVDPKTGQVVPAPTEPPKPVDPDAPAGADQSIKQAANAGAAQPAAPSSPQAPDPDESAASVFAQRVKGNKQAWDYLARYLTHKDAPILTANMVETLVIATFKRKSLFTDCIMHLLGNGEIKKEICTQILNHVEMFEDLLDKLEKSNK